MNMPTEQARLLKQQGAAKKASDRMLDALIDFAPCGKLAVDDVKFIAGWCRTVTFDALKECEE